VRPVSCYVSHLDDLLREAGIEPTKPNRKQVDLILRQITGERQCNHVWRQLKTLVADPRGRDELASKLRDGWRAATATE
jgi:hypothetical protein